MWTVHRALNVFTTWWLASSRVGNPRKNKALTWTCSYTITSPIFHWSYRPTLYLHNILCSAFFKIYFSINTAYPLIVLQSICYSKDINFEKWKAIWTFNFSENMSQHLKLSNFSVTVPLFYLKELKLKKTTTHTMSSLFLRWKWI